MRKIIVILSAFLFTLAPARAVNQWSYSDNETLYKSMLEYMHSASQTFIGEPFYFMFQQFSVEVQAAHAADKYAWMGQTQRFCNMLEAIYPPAIEHNSVMAEDRYEKLRRTIVMLKDYPMHEHTIQSEEDGGGVVPPAEQVSAFHTANKQFLDVKRNGVLDFLNSPRPTDGSIQIAKLYSSGFIFRTAGVCIGLDINYEEGMYTGDRRSELASHLDAVFITHAHGDHYDKVLMTELLKEGRPVVMPKDIVPDAPSAQKLIWDKDVTSPVTVIPGVSAQAGMAAQGTEPCLLFLVEVDGWRFAAVGDNSHTDLEEFYHGRPVPDIAIAPIFQGISQLNKHLQKGTNDEGVTPLYLTAHENEWHHTVNGRVSYMYLYKYAYQGLDANSMFTVVMDNGDHLTLSK